MMAVVFQRLAEEVRRDAAWKTEAYRRQEEQEQRRQEHLSQVPLPSLIESSQSRDELRCELGRRSERRRRPSGGSRGKSAAGRTSTDGWHRTRQTSTARSRWRLVIERSSDSPRSGVSLSGSSHGALL